MICDKPYPHPPHTVPIDSSADYVCEGRTAPAAPTTKSDTPLVDALAATIRTESLRKKCYAVAKEIGLTDEDRHELSVMVHGVPEGRPSWQRMNYEQLGRLADFMAGWIFIETIRRDRRLE